MTHYLEREARRLEERIRRDVDRLAADLYNPREEVKPPRTVTARVAPIPDDEGSETGATLVRVRDGTCLNCGRKDVFRWRLGRFGFPQCRRCLNIVRDS